MRLTLDPNAWFRSTFALLCSNRQVVDEALYRGRSLGESRVVHAVWDEVGGELVEEFVVPTISGDPRRDRQV